MFSYILTDPTRQRVFEPRFNELVADYLELRRESLNTWERRWLSFAFTFRTLMMVLDCLRVWMLATLGWLLLWLLGMH
jgi:hypothetical protein